MNGVAGEMLWAVLTDGCKQRTTQSFFPSQSAVYIEYTQELHHPKYVQRIICHLHSFALLSRNNGTKYIEQ